MKNFKKWSAVFLVQLLAVGSLAGCSGKDVSTNTSNTGGSSTQTTTSNKGEDDKKSEKPMEITIGHWDAEKALSGGANDKILTTIEEKFNVKFKPMNTTWDDYLQKIQLWAASGSLPDIFSVDAIGTSYYRDWTSQGVLKALPEDLSKYTYLNEYLDVEDIQTLKINNQLYCIPRKTYPDLYWNALDRSIIYRWDLAQEAGVTKEPETWEEFIDMMTKIIAADPENKKIGGLTARNSTLLEGVLLTYSLPAGMSDGSGSDFKWVEKDGQYVPAYFAGDAIPTFNLAREMYEKGVIEKDIALTKMQQADDKFLQGQSAAILTAGGPSSSYTYAGKYWEEVYPGENFLEDVKVLKLMPSVDGNTYFPVFRTAWSESYFSSTIDDAKMERILEIYDFLVSPEGGRLVNYGIEGEDYDVVDGNVVMRNIEEFSTKYSFTQGLGSLAQWSPSVWDTTLPATTPEGYREMDIARHEDAVTNGTLPEFDMRYTYLSTPLKDKFIIKPNDDLMNIMMGSEPVEVMYEKLLKDYEAKGLSAMIKEVNDTAKELGWQ